jgi:hypothetical protein
VLLNRFVRLYFGQMQGNKITIKYVGKLSGDEIKFSRTMEGGPGGGQAVAFTAKRAS